MPQESIEATVPKNSAAPLIFISHDSRDAELAEAFSNLLRGVSAGMLKSFRSSDKKGLEGIEFGDEWYKRLMEKLVSASDVVCLLTERSLGRPWILYEAGVAKGKLDTPVHGLALGVPLTSVSGAGPFYQFQNSDDSEDSLKKLVSQLCRRVPGLEPVDAVVESQVRDFKKNADSCVKALSEPKRGEKTATPDIAGAKVLEEMKSVVRELSMRLEQNISIGERSRTKRRLHPGMLMDAAEKLGGVTGNDPIGILVLASGFREDLPWIYEAALELYRAIQTGKSSQISRLMRNFHEVVRGTANLPYLDEIIGGKDGYRLIRELPQILDMYLQRFYRPRAVEMPVSDLPELKNTSADVDLD